MTVETDHVIAATGYDPDVDRLRFVDDIFDSDPKGRTNAGTVVQFRVVSSRLYFVGIAAAGSFGRLMRFVFGREFAARRVSGHTFEVGTPREALSSASGLSIHKIPAASTMRQGNRIE